MDSTTFTAHTLDQHRAAALVRESELLRTHKARREALPAADAPAHPGFFARLFAHRAHRGHRAAAAH